MTGYFSGNPKTEWLPDGRTMRVLEDFTFTDQAGKVWLAPAGSLTDGASIPRALWTAVGGPYEGKYRNAAIVHDVVCQGHTTNEERRAGDRMFKEACLCGGCTEHEAARLYAGVSVGSLQDALGDIHASRFPLSAVLDPPSE